MMRDTDASDRGRPHLTFQIRLHENTAAAEHQAKGDSKGGSRTGDGGRCDQRHRVAFPTRPCHRADCHSSHCTAPDEQSGLKCMTAQTAAQTAARTDGWSGRRQHPATPAAAAAAAAGSHALRGGAAVCVHVSAAVQSGRGGPAGLRSASDVVLPSAPVHTEGGEGRSQPTVTNDVQAKKKQVRERKTTWKRMNERERGLMRGGGADGDGGSEGERKKRKTKKRKCTAGLTSERTATTADWLVRLQIR